MSHYDVIIIGGGPGGYVSAIRSAQQGKKTALIEKNLLGGTCLNFGCIPSKTMLRYVDLIEQMKKATNWGVMIDNYTIDFEQMKERVKNVIEQLRQGVTYLLNSNNVEIFEGVGKIFPGKRIIVTSDQDERELTSEKIIVATGSKPFVPSISGLEKIIYYTTDTIFDLQSIPDSLTIIGGGVIGVEFANIFASLGSKVNIIEIGDRLIPTEDSQASKALKKSLEKKGVQVLLNQEVKKVDKEGPAIKIYLESSLENNNDQSTFVCDEILIAAGRQPNLEVVEALDLKRDGPYIQVDDYLETSEPGVFAIGDIIHAWQLAHVASAEGLVAIENLDQPARKMDYAVIPRAIYTNPQIATVGFTEDMLKEKGIKYDVKTFPFSASGKALANDATDGFTKILIDKTYGEILGVVMFGEQVTEIISQASAFIYLEGTVEELANMIQPHPTISESLFEAANALLKQGIHTP